MNRNLAGKRIRAARQMAEPRLNQEELMAKLQTGYGIALSKNTLSRIENGERYVTDLELVAFSKILHVSVEWLLGESRRP